MPRQNLTDTASGQRATITMTVHLGLQGSLVSVVDEMSGVNSELPE